MNKNLKDVSDIVGEWGRWQTNIAYFCVSISLFSALNNLAYSFYAPKIDYHCADNITLAINQTKPTDSCLKGCDKWWFDHSVFTSTIIDEWFLVCNRNGLASLSQSVYMIGYVFGAIIFGHISDRYGRLPALWIAVITEIMAGISSAISVDMTHFMISRFILAFSSNGRLLSAFMLVSECVGPKHRATIGMCVQMGWAFGYCLLPAIAYLLPNFRHLLLATSLPEIVWLFWLWRIPESPRWHITHQQFNKAEHQLRKAVRTNGLSLKDFGTHFEILKTNVEREEERLEKSRKSTVLDLFKTPNLRRYTLVLYLTWFVNSFVYYGISLNISDFGGDLFINYFIAGVIEFPSYLFPIFAFHFMGRRPLMAGLMFGSGLSCIAVIPFITTSTVWLRITIAMIGKFFITSSYGLIYVYAAEIYPTVVRQAGVGSCSVAARVGSIIAPFVKDLNIYTGLGAVMSIFGTLSIVDGFAVLLLPETQGKNIPDTLEEAEQLNRKLFPKTKNNEFYTESEIR